LENVKDARECHRNRREFYLTDEQVNRSLEDAVLLDGESISTYSFGDYDASVYAFQQSTKDYGNFLNEEGVFKMPFYLANLKDKPFAEQVWFNGLSRESELDACDSNIYYVNIVRGIKYNSEGEK
jgi:hypothetical protein